MKIQKKSLKDYAGRAAAFLAACLLLFLSGCGGKQQTIAAGADLESLGDQILAAVEWQDKDLAPLPDQLWDRYMEQVEREDFSQYLVIAGGGSTAEEIALFEAKDEATAEATEEAMQARYEYFRKSYENYTPEQLENLDDPVLIRSGNYVFSVISPDNAAAKKAVEDWIEAQ